MNIYRKLMPDEVQQLEAQMCSAECWDDVEVSEGFSADYVSHTRFSGKVRLGAFKGEFELAGGIRKHSGIHYATLHNVTVGDDCCIKNVKNYIANYQIG